MMRNAWLTVLAGIAIVVAATYFTQGGEAGGSASKEGATARAQLQRRPVRSRARSNSSSMVMSSSSPSRSRAPFRLVSTDSTFTRRACASHHLPRPVATTTRAPDRTPTMPATCHRSTSTPMARARPVSRQTVSRWATCSTLTGAPSSCMLAGTTTPTSRPTATTPTQTLRHSRRVMRVRGLHAA